MSLASGNLTNAALSNGAASNVTTRTIRNVSASNNSNNTEDEEEGALAGIGRTTTAPNFGFQNRISAAQQRAGINQAFTGAPGGLTGAQIGQASSQQAAALSAAIGQAGAGAAEGLAALGKMFDKGRGGGGGGQAQASSGGGGCKNGQCGNNAQASIGRSDPSAEKLTAAWNAGGAKSAEVVQSTPQPEATQSNPESSVMPLTDPKTSFDVAKLDTLPQDEAKLDEIKIDPPEPEEPAVEIVALEDEGIQDVS